MGILVLYLVKYENDQKSAMVATEGPRDRAVMKHGRHLSLARCSRAGQAERSLLSRMPRQ